VCVFVVGIRMSESVRPAREEAYRRLCDAAAALAARAGVAGVCLVDGAGGLVMAFGDGARPADGEALARLVAATDLARAIDPDGARDAPVYVHDGEYRVYARPVARDLSLLLFCETRLPPGLAYRLVETPVARMRVALDELFGGAEPRADDGADPAGDGDIFWE